MHGDSAVEVGLVLNDLGLLLQRNSKFEEAEQLLRRALDIKARHYGEDHPLTAATMRLTSRWMSIPVSAWNWSAPESASGESFRSF